MGISIFRFLGRVIHVGGTMLLFALCFIPLLRGSKSYKSDESVGDVKAGYEMLHLIGGRLQFKVGPVVGILLLAIVLSGGYNAMSLRVNDKMKLARKQMIKWKLYIYFMKTMLVVACSPVLEWSLRYMHTNVQGATVSDGELQQSAAVARIYLILLLAGVGSYCRFLREDGMDETNTKLLKGALEISKGKPGSPSAATSDKKESASAASGSESNSKKKDA